MAMALKALRPALWSTRLVCAPPVPRLCVLAYHKQHLLMKGHETSAAGCCRSMLVHGNSAFGAGYSTKASAQQAQTEAARKDESKKSDAEVTQIRSTKTAEEALQLVDDCSLSPVMASFVLHQLVFHCRDSPEGWTATQRKVVNDPRLAKLTKILLDNMKKLGSRNKTKALVNCCRLDVKRKGAMIDAFVPELRRQLRSMDVLSLYHIVSGYSSLSGNRHTKDLVYESARVMQLRWREMDQLAPTFYCRLLAVSRPFPRDYKTFVSDKVLESIDRFNLSELVQITTTLADLPLRNKAILRAIAYQAIQLGDQWETPLVHKLLESVADLSFHHQALTLQIAEFVEKNKSQWTPAAVSSIARSFMLLRIPQPGLFESIITYTLENLEEFNLQQLVTLLFASADIGFEPKNKKEFFEKVLAKIQPEFVDENITNFKQKNAAYSLMVCDQLPEFMMKEVLQTRENKKEEPANQRFSDVLLMQINTHARLACPDYQGPYLENPVLPDKLPLSQTSLHHSVWETLHKALGEGDMIKTNVWTTLGYKIDALILMDDSNKPVKLSEYLLPDLPLEEGSEDKKPVPEGFQRIAVLMWSPKNMMVESDTLTGRSIMQKKHIQLAGYKTVEVTFKQWNQAKTDFQKLSLIKFKLAEAMLIKE